MNSSYAATTSDFESISSEEVTEVCYRPAGFWIRSVATVLDLLIITVLNTIVSIGGIIAIRLAFLSAGVDNGTTAGLVVISYYFLSILLVPILYFGYFLNKFGGTPGKLLFGMKVVRSASGENIGVLGGYLREVWIKGLMFVMLGIPFLIVPWRKDRRGLHDFILGTCVVRKSSK